MGSRRGLPIRWWPGLGWGGGRWRAVLVAACAGALVGGFGAAFQQGLRAQQGASRMAGRPGPPALPADRRQELPSGGLRVGLWVQQGTLADPAGARAAVQLARRIGADALFVQVLARGEAAYRSSIWPPLVRFGGRSADPLRALLDEAHAAGLSVHAWINVYSWGRLDAPPTGPEHPLVRHPDWVTVDQRGRSLWRYRIGEGIEVNALFVDPAIEGVRSTVVETALELARRYDIDGIHLDYVRYPGPDVGFHPYALRQFWAEQEAAGAPVPQPAAGAVAVVPLPDTPAERAAWGRFRARQVTALVAALSQALGRERLPVQLSAAVLPEESRAAEAFGQEWGRWLSEGLVEAVAVMSYTDDPEQLGRWVGEATERAADRPVYAGIALFRVPDTRPQVVGALVRSAVARGAAGILYFSAEELEGREGVLQEATRAATWLRLAFEAAQGDGVMRR